MWKIAALQILALIIAAIIYSECNLNKGITPVQKYQEQSIQK